jgi:hypothetical protein
VFIKSIVHFTDTTLWLKFMNKCHFPYTFTVHVHAYACAVFIVRSHFYKMHKVFKPETIYVIFTMYIKFYLLKYSFCCIKIEICVNTNLEIT